MENENIDSQAEVDAISGIYQCLKCGNSETYVDITPRFCSKCGEPMVYQGKISEIKRKTQTQETIEEPEAEVKETKVLSMYELFNEIKKLKESGKSEPEITEWLKSYLESGHFDVSKPTDEHENYHEQFDAKTEES